MRLATSILSGFAALLAAPLPALAQDEAPDAPPPPLEFLEGETTPADAPPAQADAPTPDEVRAAIKDLDSEVFAEREAASRALWKMGRAAEELLREAIEGDQGELRYRGRRLLDEFELGLYPDTPVEIRRLVTQYRNGDANMRELAIRQLAQMDQTELLAALVRRERDPEMRDIIGNVLSEGVLRLAPEHISRGEYNRAEELLKIAAIGPQGMANYAAFLSGTGQLKDSLEKYRKRAKQSDLDTALYAWLLRVDGQFDEAVTQFEAAGQDLIARQTAASSGDPMAFADVCIDRSKTDISSLAYQLATARLGDETDREEKLLTDIEEYAAAIPNEASACLSAFIFNGYYEQAFALAERIDSPALHDLALGHYDFDTAFRRLGTKSTSGPYDAWLDDFLKAFKPETEIDVTEMLEPVEKMVRACAATAQLDEAKRLLSAIARKLEATGFSQLDIVRLATLPFWLDISEGRLSSSNDLLEFAIDSAVKAAELDFELSIVQNLYSSRDASLNSLRDELWDQLRNSKPDQSLEAALRELGGLLGNSALAEVDPKPMIAALLKRAEEEDAAEKAQYSLFAAEFAGRHSLLDTSIEAYRSAFEQMGKNARSSHYFAYADVLVRAKKYREAAGQFALAREINEAHPLAVYLQGFCLFKAGDVEEGNALRERSALMALASPFLLFTLGSYAYDNADYDYSFAANQLVTRVCRADQLPTNPNGSSPHSTLYRIHLSRREFAPAADALELANLGRLGAGYYAHYAMAYQMDWMKVKVRTLLDTEKPSEAAALMASAMKLNPTDSSMFEDAYQMLVDRGKTTEADALFQIAYPRCLTAAETFPELGQFHNNLAWLLSRTGKKLDKALEQANKALEIEPDNGAFMDTLAEVYFQRGDREKAVAASEKAIEFLGSDAQLQHQLNRFKTGKPTDR